MDWSRVLSELEMFQAKNSSIMELSALTIDTLYGSMYGLNHRYMTLRKCLQQDFSNMLSYSIRRIQKLLQSPCISFHPQPIPKTHLMGLGTYGWKYSPCLIKLAINHGLLIDTAEGYGYGRVEERLGNVFRLPQYSQSQVTTKVSRSHMSFVAMTNAARRSRHKLGVTPHYQLHFPHCRYSDEQIGKTLVSLRREGTILSIGLGNCSVDMIESMQRFLSDYSGDCIRTVQLRYNLMDRRIEKTVLPYCQRRGIAIIGYSPLGQRFSQINRPILEQIAKRIGCSAAQVALAWILRVPGVIPIPRTNNMKHLNLNIEATQIKLDAESLRELNESYPYNKGV